jgi:hypothetical protein
MRSRARPMGKADNLSAICKPIVYTVLDSWRLSTLQASATCYVNVRTQEVSIGQYMKCVMQF